MTGTPWHLIFASSACTATLTVEKIMAAAAASAMRDDSRNSLIDLLTDNLESIASYQRSSRGPSSAPIAEQAMMSPPYQNTTNGMEALGY
jgi:hypothetical protein